jgi:murein DD-endopeptidase MepM/ murein hydrolase activator NlpD
MRNRVTGKALKVVAIAGMFAGAAALSGCSSMGLQAFGDRTVTGSVGKSSPGNLSQPMPKSIGPSTRVASGPFTPPSDIGGGNPGTFVTGPANMAGQGMGNSVSTQDLPVLASSNSGNATMSAQPQLAPVAPAPQSPTRVASAPASGSTPVAVPSDAYVHVIASGESLYTIARLYNVTAQAIVSANGLPSPDKIFVGQRIVIPGMKGTPSSRPTVVADVKQPVTAVQPTSQPQSKPTVVAEVNPAQSTPKLVEPVATANKPLVQPKSEPKLSGAEKFRWPVSGRVITDFGNSKGTGINIEAPEGAAVRAAENGQVIYVGSGVEGYGNLVLIRHPNGYVSAYAHLKDMSVAKGDVVNRGDNIGSAGMTGGVSRPQLHFELRKGATPVDPIPLLAS